MGIKFLIGMTKDLIKDLPVEFKIVGVVVVVLGAVAIQLFTKKVKNSNNFNKAELGEKIEIKIGDKNIIEDSIELKNSNNFNKAKIGKNTKIEIGDRNQ